MESGEDDLEESSDGIDYNEDPEKPKSESSDSDEFSEEDIIGQAMNSKKRAFKEVEKSKVT